MILTAEMLTMIVLRHVREVDFFFTGNIITLHIRSLSL